MAIALYEYVYIPLRCLIFLFPNILRSYEAAEDNEISFVEGDRITHIEPASEDWWSGQDKQGHVGLFPANYVEVVE